MNAPAPTSVLAAATRAAARMLGSAFPSLPDGWEAEDNGNGGIFQMLPPDGPGHVTGLEATVRHRTPAGETHLIQYNVLLAPSYPGHRLAVAVTRHYGNPGNGKIIYRHSAGVALPAADGEQPALNYRAVSRLVEGALEEVVGDVLTLSAYTPPPPPPPRAAPQGYAMTMRQAYALVQAAEALRAAPVALPGGWMHTAQPGLGEDMFDVVDHSGSMRFPGPALYACEEFTFHGSAPSLVEFTLVLYPLDDGQHIGIELTKEHDTGTPAPAPDTRDAVVILTETFPVGQPLGPEPLPAGTGLLVAAHVHQAISAHLAARPLPPTPTPTRPAEGNPA